MRKPHLTLISLVILIALALTACAPPDYNDFPEPPPGFELTVDAAQQQDQPEEPDQQQQPAEQASPSVTLDILSGSATIQRAGESEARPAADGDRLGVGDTVDTGPNGLVLLTFAEGTHTYAYPGTILTITTLDTAPNGKLILVVEMAQGLTFNRTNGRTTESRDLVTPLATISTQQASASSKPSSRRYARSSPLSPARSTVFLTTQDWTGASLQRIEGQAIGGASVNVTQGGVTFSTGDPGAETRFSVPAGQSVEIDDEGQIQAHSDLTLTCDNGFCYPPEIDAWVADGTLGSDEGETAIILPPDDEICDPSFDGCGSELLEDDESDDDESGDCDGDDCGDDEPACDPAYEDCSDDVGDDVGDDQFDEDESGDCDPSAEDCDDDFSDDEFDDCDPSVEECGDEFLDDDEYSDDEYDDGYDDGSGDDY